MTDPLFLPNAIHVLKLVSGLPKAARERQQILVLQAFIDDSRSAADRATGRVLVMSGYISDAISWARFSDEWKELLDGLRWDEFKMSQVAMGGGDQSMERAEWFFRVIERHVKGQIAVSIEEQMLARVVDELKLPDVHKNPYNLAFAAIQDGLLHTQRRMNFWDPIDLIFDSQSGFEEPIAHGWRRFRDAARSRDKRVLGDVPRFLDGRKFLPLQAADLSAWWLRKYWDDNGSFTPLRSPYPWETRSPITMFLHRLEEKGLRNRLIRIKEGYIREVRDAAIQTGASTKPEEMWDDHEIWDFREIRVKMERE
jgi:hypothetical protein